MNPYFEEAKLKTRDCNSIRSYSREYYDKNKLLLFDDGFPFTIPQYFKFPTDLNFLEHITNLLGDFKLSARTHIDSASYSQERNYVEIEFKEYLKLVKEKKEHLPYAANNTIEKALLEKLKIEYPISELMGLRLPSLWIGASGTTTPLHKDSTDNFSIQLYGQKRWTIFSIRDYDNLYFQKSKYGTYINPLAEFEVSSIDMDNFSLENFPLFSKVRAFNVIVNEGDLLYLPYGWGHCVENILMSIMVNFWFKLDDYKPLILNKLT
jgi:hypothetical protein